jgi:pimeloyl-ACP methyl ester carboxylesterase
MELTIPNELKTEYPFKSHFLKIKSEDLHYIDEGDGPVVIMLHGNPTWSFFYRNVVKQLSSNHRVIVPDHIGCGLSSKNENYEYTLKNHIENVLKLIQHLKIEKFSLIVHDWGGAIGMGVATTLPDKVEKIVAMNTAGFTSSEIPFRINILRNPVGEFVIRSMNAFAYPATFMAVNKKMNNVVKKGFLLPYNNYSNRIATAKFVRDIPMDSNHPTYQTLKKIEDNLKMIKAPLLLLWGEKDFCFTMNFFHKWLSFFPNAKTKTYPRAGHYLLEDETNDVLIQIENFLN